MTYSSALFEGPHVRPHRGARRRPEAARNRLRLEWLCGVCGEDIRHPGGRPHHRQGAARFRVGAHPGCRIIFSQLRDRLLPGGLAGIQAITIQDSLFKTYRRDVDFIRRYVFPGGMLPSPEILKSLGERFGVPVIRERIFGQDYAKTLAIWRSNFRAAWPNLMPSGFDDRFRRLWEYYLAYCEAGFLSGNIDVRQVVFAKSG